MASVTPTITSIPTQQQLDELFEKAYYLERLDDLSDVDEDPEDLEDSKVESKSLLEQARERYEFLVEHGHQESKTRLAVFLHYGWGGKSDKSRSLSLLTETAAAGDKMAVYYLETHKKSGGKSLGIPQC
jgi:hypothetical protein